MSLGVTLSGSALHSTTDGNSFNVTTNLVAGQRYFLFAANDHASAGPTMTPTSAGESFTSLRTDAWTGVATRRSAVWTFVAAATNAAKVIAIAATGATGLDAICVGATDIDPTTPYVGSVAFVSDTLSPSGYMEVPLPAYASGANRPLVFIASRTGATGITEEGGYTNLGGGSHASPTMSSLVGFNATTADLTPSATNTNGLTNNWAGYALELNQLVSAGDRAVPRPNLMIPQHHLIRIDNW